MAHKGDITPKRGHQIVPSNRAAKALDHERRLDEALIKRGQAGKEVGLVPRGVHRIPANPKHRARSVNPDTGFDGDAGYAFPAFRQAQHYPSACYSWFEETGRNKGRVYKATARPRKGKGSNTVAQAAPASKADRDLALMYKLHLNNSDAD